MGFKADSANQDRANGWDYGGVGSEARLNPSPSYQIRPQQARKYAFFLYTLSI